MYDKPRFLTAGDRYVTVEIANEMNIETSFKCVAISQAIKSRKFREVVEVVVAFRSLMVYFDNQKIKMADMVDRLRRITEEIQEVDEIPSRLIELPARYGGKWGPDLHVVAEVNKITEQETAERHSAAPHWVGIVGFTPGHPFLMSLNPPEKILNAPKYKIPRTYTPIGTMGLGGNITSMYTVPSPGGYQKFAFCPIPLYDPYQRLEAFSESPILLRVGDRLKFRMIDDDELDNLRQAIFDGLYEYKIREETFSLRKYLSSIGKKAK